MRFAIPLCGSFFCRVTPYGLMEWNRALQKNNFASSHFFSHMWTASNPRKIYMWIDLGTPKDWQTFLDAQRVRYCYRNLSFKAFFLLILSLCHGCKGLGLVWLAAAKNQFFRLYLFFPRYSLKLEAFAKKRFFRLLKIVFFRTALMKLRQARLCKKNSFSGSIFFCMPLVKSANSTSLPRLSSLQIAQMHAMHN